MLDPIGVFLQGRLRGVTQSFIFRKNPRQDDFDRKALTRRLVEQNQRGFLHPCMRMFQRAA